MFHLLIFLGRGKGAQLKYGTVTFSVCDLEINIQLKNHNAKRCFCNIVITCTITQLKFSQCLGQTMKYTSLPAGVSQDSVKSSVQSSVEAQLGPLVVENKHYISY